MAIASGAGCHDRPQPQHLRPEASQVEIALDAAVLVDTASAPARPPVLRVPFTKAPLVPSGRFDVNVWAPAVNTHTLLDEHGHGAVPVSEARFLWGGGGLYVFFYAADVDLQVKATQHDGPVWKDDGAVLEFPSAGDRKFVIDVSPTGVVADAICPLDAADVGDARCDLHWESGVRVGTDYDGTINTLGDFDEEWAVEMAVPLASIAVRPPFAGAQIPFSLFRCEVAHDGKRACGSWGRQPGQPGTLVLAPQQT
jgi:hypothetical protein